MDALAGVEAGRRGGFSLVISVDRFAQAEALREHDADVVVQDSGEVASEEPYSSTALERRLRPNSTTTSAPTTAAAATATHRPVFEPPLSAVAAPAFGSMSR